MKYTALVSDWSAIRTNTAAAISEKTWTFHHHLYNYADKLDLLAKIKIDPIALVLYPPRDFSDWEKDQTDRQVLTGFIQQPGAIQFHRCHSFQTSMVFLSLFATFLATAWLTGSTVKTSPIYPFIPRPKNSYTSGLAAAGASPGRPRN